MMRGLLTLLLAASCLTAVGQDGVCCDPGSPNYAPLDCATWGDYAGDPDCGPVGCTDLYACNYDGTAIADDGSDFTCYGCTDLAACNFTR